MLLTELQCYNTLQFTSLYVFCIHDGHPIVYIGRAATLRLRISFIEIGYPSFLCVNSSQHDKSICILPPTYKIFIGVKGLQFHIQILLCRSIYIYIYWVAKYLLSIMSMCCLNVNKQDDIDSKYSHITLQASSSQQCLLKRRHANKFRHSHLPFSVCCNFIIFSHQCFLRIPF